MFTKRKNMYYFTYNFCYKIYKLQIQTSRLKRIYGVSGFFGGGG